VANDHISISDINQHCLSEFRTHWQCLENHNQQLWNCRSEERRMNKCVFEKLVRIRVSRRFCRVLTSSEPGEEDTRHTQGRDSGPSADTQHLCDALNFVYIYGPAAITTTSTSSARPGMINDHDLFVERDGSSSLPL
jgi:hypothetical protein